MIYKFLLISMSLSLLADDENVKSSGLNEQSQIRLQNVLDVKAEKPILYPMLYPKDMSGIDDITGYQGYKVPKLVNFDGKKRSSQDFKAIPSSQDLTLAQLQDLTIAQMFDKAKFEKLREFPKLTIKPDVTKAFSIIKKFKEKKVAQEAQPQKSLDDNLSVYAVDDQDYFKEEQIVQEAQPQKSSDVNLSVEAVDTDFTRHKSELDLLIPEQKDFDKDGQVSQSAYQAGQSQTSSDVNLSVDAVDELDKEFEPNITRHKIELDLEITEHQDFYDELIYLIALGLNLEKEKVKMSSYKVDDKKLFTLTFVDPLTEDNFKNELKYFRKIAKIRASYPDAILPKKYLDVAQKLEGEELQKALNNYYREYESQVKSVLASAVAEEKKLPYHDFSQAIQAAINKSKEILGDYLQIANELIEEPDYKPTSEITEKVIEIRNLLQSENSVIKTNLSKLKDYLERNNFDGELIEVVRKLFSDLENFRKILLTKNRLKTLSQDTDFSADYENIKKYFDAKAVNFYDQKYQ